MTALGTRSHFAGEHLENPAVFVLYNFLIFAPEPKT